MAAAKTGWVISRHPNVLVGDYPIIA